ncbi:hypothetical protein PSQ39_06585 [Curvibacter sp. HBC28]|uniref:XRE family transcriptional regulator n=1 Tax=Curvibacter microcysteis TaxID=3026419 RepID=A0ABT5MCI7_9BURK|nr:hypothetical protein [Curvibacter sp. HBC28]MDD0814293.1 hypothetical protein [Curvibacter sp. HBC28]
MPIYAQLNDADIVIAVSQLAGEVDAAHMVPLDTLRPELLGQHCDLSGPEPVFTAVEPTPPTAPQSVSMRQAKRALLAAGLLDAADLAIASIPDDTARRAAQIDWTTSTEVRRDWPLVAAIAQALSLTDEQIDALFASASQL